MEKRSRLTTIVEPWGVGRGWGTTTTKDRPWSLGGREEKTRGPRTELMRDPVSLPYPTPIESQRRRPRRNVHRRGGTGLRVSRWILGRVSGHPQGWNVYTKVDEGVAEIVLAVLDYCRTCHPKRSSVCTMSASVHILRVRERRRTKD